MRAVAFGGLLASVVVAVACGASSNGGGGPNDGSSGPSEGGGGPETSGHDGAQDGGVDVTGPIDTGADAHADSANAPDGAEAGGGVHQPACCARTASDDSMCTTRGEPSTAYVCFCPDGGIDPSCTINMGTELVCCP